MEQQQEVPAVTLSCVHTKPSRHIHQCTRPHTCNLYVPRLALVMLKVTAGDGLQYTLHAARDDEGGQQPSNAATQTMPRSGCCVAAKPGDRQCNVSV